MYAQVGVPYLLTVQALVTFLLTKCMQYHRYLIRTLGSVRRVYVDRFSMYLQLLHVRIAGSNGDDESMRRGFRRLDFTDVMRPISIIQSANQTNQID